MADSERVTGQLADLTNKYSEAQRNAQKAMALFKETRDENDMLKSNFEALKQVRASVAARGHFPLVLAADVLCVSQKFYRQ